MTKARRSALGLRLNINLFLGLLVFFIASQCVQAQWATNGNNINNTNTGNVGIGTTSPGTTLDVQGNTLTLGSDFGTTTRTNNAIKLNRLAMPAYTLANLKFSVIAGATTSTDNIVGVGGAAGGFAASTLIVFHTAANTNTDTGTERMRIDSAGNIGLGTTSPVTQLDVQVNSATANKLIGRFGNNSTSGGGALRVYANVTSSATLYPALELTDSSFWVASLAADRTTGLRFRTGSNVGSGEANLTDRMVISPAGNVGIGTTNPLAFASGNLGAGTYAHISSAGVAGLAVTGTFPEVLLYDSDGVANSRIFQIMQDGGLAKIRVVNDAISNLSIDNVQVWNLSTGNVGIGTSAPTEKLHVQGNGKVTGNLTVDGNIAAKYQDVAEWVPAAKALAPGTVVTLNRTQSNFVEASTKAYDTRVAGVISESPGITLGERGENKVLVASTGRVRMKVDAANGPIEIGDLLVTSDKEGVAMKSMPVNIGGVEIHRPGTLIGKALEPLAKGQGEILVLLSLQ